MVFGSVLEKSECLEHFPGQTGNSEGEVLWRPQSYPGSKDSSRSKIRKVRQRERERDWIRAVSYSFPTHHRLGWGFLLTGGAYSSQYSAEMFLACGICVKLASEFRISICAKVSGCQVSCSVLKGLCLPSCHPRMCFCEISETKHTWVSLVLGFRVCPHYSDSSLCR